MDPEVKQDSDDLMTWLTDGRATGACIVCGCRHDGVDCRAALEQALVDQEVANTLRLLRTPEGGERVGC